MTGVETAKDVVVPFARGARMPDRSGSGTASVDGAGGSYHPADWLRPWRITGPRVEVDFRPFHVKAARTELGLLGNRTRQCFGSFTGGPAPTRGSGSTWTA